MKYVPMDFIKDDLKVHLVKSGYDPAKRTLFIMEGLTFYLPGETIDRVLAFISKNSGILSAVIFDYMTRSAIDGTSDRTEVKTFRVDLQNYGEYLRFGLESDELETFLMQRGFELKDNVNAPDCKDKYFQGQSRHREITPVFWFAHAVVREG